MPRQRAGAGVILVDKAAEDAEEANHHRLVPTTANHQSIIRDGRRRQMDLAAKEQPATRQPSQTTEDNWLRRNDGGETEIMSRPELGAMKVEKGHL